MLFLQEFLGSGSICSPAYLSKGFCTSIHDVTCCGISTCYCIFSLTCKQSEVTRASDRYVGWDDISSFYAILSHLVKIWCVHIPVIIPSESIKGDEQKLVSSCCTGFFDWSKESWRNCKQPKTYRQQHG